MATATVNVQMTQDQLSAFQASQKQAAGNTVSSAARAKSSNGKVNGDPATDPTAFVLAAIRCLRQLPGNKNSKGIHTVYSGFNSAFRQQFHTDPVELTKSLAAKGIIDSIPARGGARIYLAGEVPQRLERDSSAVIASILS